MKPHVHFRIRASLLPIIALCFLLPVISFAQPANNLCANAILLTSSTSCVTTAGTLVAATYTAGGGVPGCNGNATIDVWYKFVAQTPNPTITVTSASTRRRSELFSGSCGSLTSVACSGNNNNIVASGLTIGQTYYVRVHSSSATTFAFNICITDPPAATYDYSKSYVNITKNAGGGTISPGDTLEIRATLVIKTLTLDSLSFMDTLYHNGGVRLVPGSLALQTNEGKIYKSFTDALDADAGYHYTSGLDTVIRINIGQGATATARGKLLNTSKPSVFGGTCIIMATYRVVVYKAYNTMINVGGGCMTYKDPAIGVSGNLSFVNRNAVVYSSPGLCPNAVSVTNAIGGDYNGTFGVPLTGAPLARNRGTSSNVPSYVYQTFAPGQGPQDYYYGITNNTSATFTTINTWLKPDTKRVFSVWDITGDHTGAANTAKGNAPCDTTLPMSASNPCGYMLVINSAYKTDTSFQYSVTNLCPNTYYEVSAWIKNICSKCSCDSNGVGAQGAGYVPFAPGDSSGVQPNLAFDIDGVDYFTTGNIVNTGVSSNQQGSDSTNTWVKRGFTYLTGLAQTSLTLSIRNNAPGGGGNDWALDDISLATCLPNMKYSPSLNPTVCDSNSITINDTVQSYFNNYNYYKWQRSTDGGTTWSDVTGPLGPTAPVWNGTAWEYITSYTIPPANTRPANNGDKYRVVTATTSTNLLNTDCQATDGVSIISLNVINCGIPLAVQLLALNGKVDNDHANLKWTTTGETDQVTYSIERSNDGNAFFTAGSITGRYNYATAVNNYSFIDPLTISEKAWYRILSSDHSGAKKYSNVIKLTNSEDSFNVVNVINPFSGKLVFDISSPENTKVEVLLTDLSGRTVRKNSYVVYSGITSLSLDNTYSLSPGIYILQVMKNDMVIKIKVLKN